MRRYVVRWVGSEMDGVRSGWMEWGEMVGGVDGWVCED